MPLDDATKARLKEAAERKKGRDTLNGLDRTLGLVALDFVQEKLNDRAVPDARINRDGYLEYREEVNSSFWTEAEDEDGMGAKFTRRFVRGEKLRTYTWVTLRHCPNWIPEEFAGRFPSRRIKVEKYKGPNESAESATLIALPCPLVVCWFRFLWPEPDEWGPRAQKYLTGYTEKYTQQFPGVGAKIKITAGTYETGKVVDVVSWNYETFWVQDEMKVSFSIHPRRDTWTLVE